MDEDFLLISGIQHFCFCRRQWALIHIENTWSDNYLTADGQVMHERVHDFNLITKHDGVFTLRGLHVRSSKLQIVGECDAVELIPDKLGIPLQNRDGLWRIQPVEYKRGRPKIGESDRLQLVAECVCLEEMFACNIRNGYLYYGEIRHRELVEITDDLRRKLEQIVGEMWKYYKSGYTPKVKKTKSCERCSLLDQCMPEINKSKLVSDYVKEHVLED